MLTKHTNHSRRRTAIGAALAAAALLSAAEASAQLLPNWVAQHDGVADLLSLLANWG